MAIALPALLMITGFVADYGYASYLNQRLGRASDAAVLAAVGQSAAAAVGGASNTTKLKALGTNVFTETVTVLGLSNVTFGMSVTQASTTKVVTATATYSYNAPAFFGGMVGRTSIPLSGTISASSQPPLYANYYILVDNSNSMGIGATQDDMTTLWAATAAQKYTFPQDGSLGCVFACHIVQSGHKYSSYDIARSAGVTLRIDSAISAIQSSSQRHRARWDQVRIFTSGCIRLRIFRAQQRRPIT